MSKVLEIILQVSDGARQEAILSPVLFIQFIDDLYRHLKDCQTGCMVGNLLANHIRYADNRAALSLSSIGLQQLLSTCSCVCCSADRVT